MTLTQFIAALLYTASLVDPVVFHHNYARRDLMRCLRGVG